MVCVCVCVCVWCEGVVTVLHEALMGKGSKRAVGVRVWCEGVV